MFTNKYKYICVVILSSILNKGTICFFMLNKYQIEFYNVIKTYCIMFTFLFNVCIDTLRSKKMVYILKF